MTPEVHESAAAQQKRRVNCGKLVKMYTTLNLNVIYYVYYVTGAYKTTRASSPLGRFRQLKAHFLLNFPKGGSPGGCDS